MNYSNKQTIFFPILDYTNHLSNIDSTSEYFVHLVGVNMQETPKTQNKHLHNELLAEDGKNYQEFIDQSPVDADSYVKESLIKSTTKKKQDLKNTGSVTQPTLKTLPLTYIQRIGVICYVPKGIEHALTFLSMLFGSWKYMTANRNKLINRNMYYHNIDLLAFCHPEICPFISHVCDIYNETEESKREVDSRCWAIEQKFEMNVSYAAINSFVMFKRTDIYKILKPYKYVMRTDFDVFLSPKLFTCKPKFDFMVGRGGYCDPFNMERLKNVAKKLGLVHRGVHCVGSTWYGDTELLIQISKKTIELTAYMYKNEFHPKLAGLESIPFDKNPDGEWVRWWRPVSSMYGGELATNHYIKNFSESYKGQMDIKSCTKTSILNTLHIHCVHNDCEFHKFRFLGYLNLLLEKETELPREMMNHIVKSIYPRDVSNMTIPEYCSYIAWNSVGKYCNRFFIHE